MGIRPPAAEILFQIRTFPFQAASRQDASNCPAMPVLRGGV
jgi:hypothetical protein